jgi:hypothetical protein
MSSSRQLRQGQRAAVRLDDDLVPDRSSIGPVSTELAGDERKDLRRAVVEPLRVVDKADEWLAPGQTVVPHGVDRDLDLDEAVTGGPA